MLTDSRGDVCAVHINVSLSNTQKYNQLKKPKKTKKNNVDQFISGYKETNHHIKGVGEIDTLS